MSRSFRLAALLALPLAGAQALGQVTGHPEPLSLLASDDPALAANKRLVFDLWRSIVNAGHVELADQLLAENYIQHSPVLPTGRAAFKQIFSAVPRLERIPDLVSPPLVALVAEGPYVVMALAETVPDPAGAGSYTTTHFNLFRVENGRLAEHWHSVQTAPGPTVLRPEDGGPQPVTGRAGVEQYALLEAVEPGLAWNKRQVFDFWRQVADAGRQELAAVYASPGFVSHSASAGPGLDSFATYFSVRRARPIAIALEHPLVAMVAEGDLVVQVRMQQYAHPIRAGDTYTTTWFDMFRFADGRLVEHWDPALRPSPGACVADGGLSYVCGLTNAEDLVAIDGGRWLVASSITSRGESVGAGRLYLVDAATRTAEELFPGRAPELRRDVATYGDCTIDLDAFDTHGLALKGLSSPGRYRLYATSHGSREAIQAFELDASGERPRIVWVGCVPLPAGVWANSVAILADGGFVTTQFYDPLDPESIGRVLRGEPNGSVFEWHPGGEVAEVPGTRLSGPNGIALSVDDRELYVAAFGSRSVLRFDRGPNPSPPASVSLDITADNLRWSSRGTLLLAGSNAEAGTGWTVYEIDPATMSASPLILVDGNAALQGTSTAVEVGSELWFGTPGGDRVGYRPLP